MQKFKMSIIPYDKPVPLPWDFMGNSIIDPLVKETSDSPNAPNLKIIDNTSLFLENKFDIPLKYNLPSYGPDLYKKFYFSKHINISVKDMITISEYGVLLLHNSWTPPNYLSMSASRFIRQDIAMAEIFRNLLDTDTIDESKLIQIPIAKNSIPIKPTYNNPQMSNLNNATIKKVNIKTGRNDPCPCGSGKKYKNCCSL